jgi:diguanylate cyclase (GGDEF)-like protein
MNGALLFIDMDNFKTLNDTLGHDIGDLLLQQVASRLEACVRESDTVARIGGDEFVIMLENLNEKSSEAAIQAKAIGEQIIKSLNQPYQLKTFEYQCTPSIGATLFSEQDCTSIDNLLKQADIAMYQAKAMGRNTLRFFDPSMQAAVLTRANLENELRQGLKELQFMLYYQPQVDKMGQISGVEALLRWRHPQQGLVSPGEFILLAEETGLIMPLGQWVLETACSQLVQWESQAETTHLTIAVNVSVRQFRQTDFAEQIIATLNRIGANPAKLKIELTESLLAWDVQDIIIKMNKLRDYGISFSLDDFGTGYSSLYYLKQLPLDQLKIDQSFVRDIMVDVNDAAIAKMIIALATSIGLAVIAEGVENLEQRNYLITLGCHHFQGYLFGKPEPIEKIEALLKQTIVHVKSMAGNSP